MVRLRFVSLAGWLRLGRLHVRRPADRTFLRPSDPPPGWPPLLLSLSSAPTTRTTKKRSARSFAFGHWGQKGSHRVTAPGSLPRADWLVGLVHQGTTWRRLTAAGALRRNTESAETVSTATDVDATKPVRVSEEPSNLKAANLLPPLHSVTSLLVQLGSTWSDSCWRAVTMFCFL